MGCPARSCPDTLSRTYGIQILCLPHLPGPPAWEPLSSQPATRWIPHQSENALLWLKRFSEIEMPSDLVLAR